MLYRDYIKRILDFTLALVMLVLLSPLLIVVTIWLHFANKGAGAFFIQERPGKDGKVFKVIKFKTMTDERDENGELLPNDVRLTNIGRFIRSLSIDELPQFINILKGDMALIGPRPLLTWFLPLYTQEQSRRHNVRPGITGWAQVNGRNTLFYSKKFEYDIYYVDHLSMSLDIKIIWMTILNVIRKKDIGNGLQHEVDDLGWSKKEEWATKEFEEKYNQ